MKLWNRYSYSHSYILSWFWPHILILNWKGVSWVKRSPPCAHRMKAEKRCLLRCFVDLLWRRSAQIHIPQFRQNVSEVARHRCVSIEIWNIIDSISMNKSKKRVMNRRIDDIDITSQVIFTAIFGAKWFDAPVIENRVTATTISIKNIII